MQSKTPLNSDDLLYLPKNFEKSLVDKSSKILENEKVNSSIVDINDKLNIVIAEVDDTINTIDNTISEIHANINNKLKHIEHFEVEISDNVVEDFKSNTIHPETQDGRKGISGDTTFNTNKYINTSIFTELSGYKTIYKSEDWKNNSKYIDNTDPEYSNFKTISVPLSVNEKLKVVDINFNYRQRVIKDKLTLDESGYYPIFRNIECRLYIIQNGGKLIVKSTTKNADNTVEISNSIQHIDNVLFSESDGPEIYMDFYNNGYDELVIVFRNITPFQYNISNVVVDNEENSTILKSIDDVIDSTFIEVGELDKFVTNRYRVSDFHNAGPDKTMYFSVDRRNKDIIMLIHDSGSKICTNVLPLDNPRINDNISKMSFHSIICMSGEDATEKLFFISGTTIFNLIMVTDENNYVTSFRLEPISVLNDMSGVISLFVDGYTAVINLSDKIVIYDLSKCEIIDEYSISSSQINNILDTSVCGYIDMMCNKEYRDGHDLYISIENVGILCFNFGTSIFRLIENTTSKLKVHSVYNINHLSEHTVNASNDENLIIEKPNGYLRTFVTSSYDDTFGIKLLKDYELFDTNVTSGRFTNIDKLNGYVISEYTPEFYKYDMMSEKFILLSKDKIKYLIPISDYIYIFITINEPKVLNVYDVFHNTLIYKYNLEYEIEDLHDGSSLVFLNTVNHLMSLHHTITQVCLTDTEYNSYVFSSSQYTMSPDLIDKMIRNQLNQQQIVKHIDDCGDIYLSMECDISIIDKMGNMYDNATEIKEGFIREINHRELVVDDKLSTFVAKPNTGAAKVTDLPALIDESDDIKVVPTKVEYTFSNYVYDENDEIIKGSTIDDMRQQIYAKLFDYYHDNKVIVEKLFHIPEFKNTSNFFELNNEFNDVNPGTESTMITTYNILSNIDQSTIDRYSVLNKFRTMVLNLNMDSTSCSIPDNPILMVDDDYGYTPFSLEIPDTSILDFSIELPETITPTTLKYASWKFDSFVDTHNHILYISLCAGGFSGVGLGFTNIYMMTLDEPIIKFRRILYDKNALFNFHFVKGLEKVCTSVWKPYNTRCGGVNTESTTAINSTHGPHEINVDENFDITVSSYPQFNDGDEHYHRTFRGYNQNNSWFDYKGESYCLLNSVDTTTTDHAVNIYKYNTTTNIFEFVHNYNNRNDENGFKDVYVSDILPLDDVTVLMLVHPYILGEDDGGPRSIQGISKTVYDDYYKNKHNVKMYEDCTITTIESSINIDKDYNFIGYKFQKYRNRYLIYSINNSFFDRSTNNDLYENYYTGDTGRPIFSNYHNGQSFYSDFKEMKRDRMIDDTQTALGIMEYDFEHVNIKPFSRFNINPHVGIIETETGDYCIDATCQNVMVIDDMVTYNNNVTNTIVLNESLAFTKTNLCFDHRTITRIEGTGSPTRYNILKNYVNLSFDNRGVYVIQQYIDRSSPSKGYLWYLPNYLNRDNNNIHDPDKTLSTFQEYDTLKFVATRPITEEDPTPHDSLDTSFDNENYTSGEDFAVYDRYKADNEPDPIFYKDWMNHLYIKDFNITLLYGSGQSLMYIDNTKMDRNDEYLISPFNLQNKRSHMLPSNTSWKNPQFVFDKVVETPDGLYGIYYKAPDINDGGRNNFYRNVNGFYKINVVVNELESHGTDVYYDFKSDVILADDGFTDLYFVQDTLFVIYKNAIYIYDLTNDTKEIIPTNIKYAPTKIFSDRDKTLALFDNKNAKELSDNKKLPNYVMEWVPVFNRFNEPVDYKLFKDEEYENLLVDNKDIIDIFEIDCGKYLLYYELDTENESGSYRVRTFDYNYRYYDLATEVIITDVERKDNCIVKLNYKNQLLYVFTCKDGTLKFVTYDKYRDSMILVEDKHVFYASSDNNMFITDPQYNYNLTNHNHIFINKTASNEFYVTNERFSYSIEFIYKKYPDLEEYEPVIRVSQLYAYEQDRIKFIIPNNVENKAVVLEKGHVHNGMDECEIKCLILTANILKNTRTHNIGLSYGDDFADMFYYNGANGLHRIFDANKVGEYGSYHNIEMPTDRSPNSAANFIGLNKTSENDFCTNFSIVNGEYMFLNIAHNDNKTSFASYGRIIQRSNSATESFSETYNDHDLNDKMHIYTTTDKSRINHLDPYPVYYKDLYFMNVSEAIIKYDPSEGVLGQSLELPVIWDKVQENDSKEVNYFGCHTSTSRGLLFGTTDGIYRLDDNMEQISKYKDIKQEDLMNVVSIKEDVNGDIFIIHGTFTTDEDYTPELYNFHLRCSVIPNNSDKLFHVFELDDLGNSRQFIKTVPVASNTGVIIPTNTLQRKYQLTAYYLKQMIYINSVGYMLFILDSDTHKYKYYTYDRKTRTMQLKQALNYVRDSNRSGRPYIDSLHSNGLLTIEEYNNQMMMVYEDNVLRYDYFNDKFELMYKLNFNYSDSKPNETYFVPKIFFTDNKTIIYTPQETYLYNEGDDDYMVNYRFEFESTDSNFKAYGGTSVGLYPPINWQRKGLADNKLSNRIGDKAYIAGNSYLDLRTMTMKEVFYEEPKIKTIDETAVEGLQKVKYLSHFMCTDDKVFALLVVDVFNTVNKGYDTGNPNKDYSYNYFENYQYIESLYVCRDPENSDLFIEVDFECDVNQENLYNKLFRRMDKRVEKNGFSSISIVRGFQNTCKGFMFVNPYTCNDEKDNHVSEDYVTTSNVSFVYDDVENVMKSINVPDIACYKLSEESYDRNNVVRSMKLYEMESEVYMAIHSLVLYDEHELQWLQLKKLSGNGFDFDYMKSLKCQDKFYHKFFDEDGNNSNVHGHDVLGRSDSKYLFSEGCKMLMDNGSIFILYQKWDEDLNIYRLANNQCVELNTNLQFYTDGFYRNENGDLYLMGICDYADNNYLYKYDSVKDTFEVVNNNCENDYTHINTEFGTLSYINYSNNHMFLDYKFRGLEPGCSNNAQSLVQYCSTHEDLMKNNSKSLILTDPENVFKSINRSSMIMPDMTLHNVPMHNFMMEYDVRYGHKTDGEPYLYIIKYNRFGITPMDMSYTDLSTYNSVDQAPLYNSIIFKYNSKTRHFDRISDLTGCTYGQVGFRPTSYQFDGIETATFDKWDNFRYNFLDNACTQNFYVFDDVELWINSTTYPYHNIQFRKPYKSYTKRDIDVFNNGYYELDITGFNTKDYNNMDVDTSASNIDKLKLTETGIIDVYGTKNGNFEGNSIRQYFEMKNYYPMGINSEEINPNILGYSHKEDYNINNIKTYIKDFMFASKNTTLWADRFLKPDNRIKDYMFKTNQIMGGFEDNIRDDVLIEAKLTIYPFNAKNDIVGVNDEVTINKWFTKGYHPDKVFNWEEDEPCDIIFGTDEVESSVTITGIELEVQYGTFLYEIKTMSDGTTVTELTKGIHGYNNRLYKDGVFYENKTQVLLNNDTELYIDGILYNEDFFVPETRDELDTITASLGMTNGVTALPNMEHVCTKYITDLSSLCSGYVSLTDISGISYWNTSSVTDLSDTFAGCTVLSDLTPLNNWDVSSVTDVEHLFNDCDQINEVKINSLITEWKKHPYSGDGSVLTYANLI